ncbi:AraC family transcriptional regulator [Stieleria sp. JC731]|uniref:AraC family transcriptional regulator n=1 Tax=Pirellulaceae TaxID=2691357 RepID=UPI001E647BAE|nr:AraC family transcriptional regulator [Stieleria sp. JC731]MCC9601924.1 AraC family transcriptional regulator [Stieleria sp. JC731]
MNEITSQQLVECITRHSTPDNTIQTAIAELQLSQYAAPTELTSLVYEPCLCLIAQGSKEVVLSGESYRLDPAQFLLVSVDLPVDARVVEATQDEPYLGLRISLDPKLIGEMLADGTSIPTGSSSERGLAVTDAESRLLDAVTRLTNLLDEPNDIRPLAPLILREITHRVLTGPQGFRLRQIAMAGAPANRIAMAIRWLKDNFTNPLTIESLAEQVGLSVSSFHLHFKNVTAMTPLQYQKRLRLQEARSLMLTEKLDAAGAAYRVGYESPSQFSREYRRMFGAPPRQDVANVLSETR